MKYGIIGYPVNHSLSPVMHEAGFKATGLEGVYDRIPIQPGELEDKIRYLIENHYDGWNVTYPLKEEIMRVLDHITPEALACGAVNTVKAVNGILSGHNTDGSGFVQSLLDRGYDFNHKNVVILGAGGSARAIAVALSQKNCNVTIRNRSQAKANELVEVVTALGGAIQSSTFEAGSWLEEVDLLIQTTPLGMNGEPYSLGLQGINPNAWVVDLIYNPKVTRFLASAANYGCYTMNGLDMLLFQGVLAWKFWFEREAPVHVMRRALLDT